MLPIALALVGEQGRLGEEQLLVMEAERASITLQGEPGDTPLPFRCCGASRRRSMCVWSSRWRSACSCWLPMMTPSVAGMRPSAWHVRCLLARAENQPKPAVEAALIQALDQRISAYDGGDGMDLAALLALPGMAELEALQSPVDPLALDQAFRAIGLRRWAFNCSRPCADSWSWPELTGPWLGQLVRAAVP